MKVSVLLPTYNRPHMLPRAIESFINQDYKNSELIILNDGGTDETQNVINHYAKLDERIKVIRYEQNVLPPKCFNEILEFATGDLVCHLHDDDEMLPNGISLRVEAFKKDPSLQVLYAGWLTNGVKHFYQTDKDQIVQREAINYPTLMWKRTEVDGRMDTDLRYYHDWLWKIEAFQKYKVGFITEPVIDYKIHLGQASVECRTLGKNGEEEQLMRKKLSEKYGI